MVTRDSDLIFLGMILIAGSAVLQTFRDTRYAVYVGNVSALAEYCWVAGLIVVTIGLFRFVRRVEARLAT